MKGFIANNWQTILSTGGFVGAVSLTTYFAYKTCKDTGNCPQYSDPDRVDHFATQRMMIKDDRPSEDRLRSAENRLSDDAKVLEVRKQIGDKRFKEIYEEQISKPAYRTFAGEGTGTKFREADIAARRYGGNPEDYVKESSEAIPYKSDKALETHWIRNIKTGKRYEIKQKVVNYNPPK